MAEPSSKKTILVSADLAAFISDATPDDVCARYARLSARAKEANFGVFDEDVVVIDTETTGFSFVHDELTQIAAARMSHGEITEWFVTFVNPGKPIPDDVAHLTNIHDEDVAQAPSAEEALAQLVKFVGGSMVVAHNAHFDKTFTTRHPSGYPLLENLWIDSLDLSRIALPRLKSHRLLDLVRAFGAPLSTHRADADVEATCAVFRILLAAVEAMPADLVAEIAGLASPKEWPTQVVFDYFTKQNELHGASYGSGFSLRAMRSVRATTMQKAPKPDAEMLASDPQKGLRFPSAQEIEQAFDEGGTVSHLYERYEGRPEQKEMARAVRDAFAASENLVVEAGTGVGKSMAYLLPAALVAVKNNISVGVATKTNTLLDQLVYKELPALATALTEEGATQRPLSFAALKGFSHYPCLLRVQRQVEAGAQMKEVGGYEQSQAPAMAALLSYIEQSEYDDMDGLKIDYRLLSRRSITTTSRECLRRKCPFYGSSCFVHGARKQAESADILVTNHSLLFCDIAADGGLLPPVRYWVVDEAHGAEVEARRAFTTALESEAIDRLAARLEDEQTTRNVFVRAERRPSEGLVGEAQTLYYGLIAKAKSAGAAYAQAAKDYCFNVKYLLFFAPQKKGRGYETADVWLNDEVCASATFAAVKTAGANMASAAEKLIAAAQDLVAYLEGVEGMADLQREIATLAMDLKDQVQAVEIILQQQPEGFAYSATLYRKKDRYSDKLEALPVFVGEKLNETFYARTHAVVFASATLAVGDSFDSFEGALGLNASEFSRTKTLQLASSYNFDENMTVYVASDIPDPNEAGYLEALQKLLINTHLAQQGSMLTLFTNRREMENCFEAVQPALKAADLRLVCQKWGVSVKGLRDDFIADEHLSLFALKSFWEGFDAPGGTLKGVTIPKLPFAKPTDPLSCERAARDDQAWRHYVLPAAVLETKQAAGRLIRRSDDTGVLILADHRVLSKSYGRTFLKSLPSQNIKVLTCKEIAAELEKRN